jgi:hypothetical protein
LVVVEVEEKAAPEGPRIVSQSWGYRQWEFIILTAWIQFGFPLRTGSRLFPATPAETSKSARRLIIVLLSQVVIPFAIKTTSNFETSAAALSNRNNL